MELASNKSIVKSQLRKLNMDWLLDAIKHIVNFVRYDNAIMVRFKKEKTYLLDSFLFTRINEYVTWNFL